MRAIGKGASCSKSLNLTRRIPCRMRSEVPSAPPDAGADEADGADREKVRARPPLLALRLDEGDTEHPVIVQCPREHLTKTRLKDVEGKQGVGEKQDAGKRHDGHSGGSSTASGIGGHDSISIHIRAPGAPELGEGGLPCDVRSAKRDIGEGRAKLIESVPGFEAELSDPHRGDREQVATGFEESD